MEYLLRTCVYRNNWKEYIKQVISACKIADIKEIMLCEESSFIAAIPQPLEFHREMADTLKRVVIELRENNIVPSFYLKSLVGHNDSNVYTTDFVKMISITGYQSQSEPCLLDKNFQEYTATLMSYYAECGFARMMLDDDFRFLYHCDGNDCCVCDLHIKEVEKIYGKPLSREQLIKALKSDDEESSKIAKVFRTVNKNAQEEFARNVEKRVHEVDKDVQIGLMISTPMADEKQGRDTDELLKAFAGKDHQPFCRPGGGAYFNVNGKELLNPFRNLKQYQSYLQTDVDFVSEVDVFSPRTIYSKSVRTLDIQIQMHSIAGYNKCSLNIFDHYNDSPLNNMEYLDLLKRRKDDYTYLHTIIENKRLKGICVPLKKGMIEVVNNPRIHASGINNYSKLLLEVGLPVSYNSTKSDVMMLSGEWIDCISDDEIMNVLSGGVIIDNLATKKLCERGFSSYIGVDCLGQYDFPCYEKVVEHTFTKGYKDKFFPAYTGNKTAGTEDFYGYLEKPYILKLQKDVQVMSELMDASFNVLTPSSIIFENKLGGRVCCLATSFHADLWKYKARVAQLHNIYKYLLNEDLPFNTSKCASVAPIWYVGDNQEVVFFYNFGLDKQCVEIGYGQDKKVLELDGMQIASAILENKKIIKIKVID